MYMYIGDSVYYHISLIIAKVTINFSSRIIFLQKKVLLKFEPGTFCSLSLPPLDHMITQL